MRLLLLHYRTDLRCRIADAKVFHKSIERLLRRRATHRLPVRVHQRNVQVVLSGAGRGMHEGVHADGC